MPSLTRILSAGCMLIAVFLMPSGCGDDDARFDSVTSVRFGTDTSVHPSNWLPAKHAFHAMDNVDSCRECHGTDLASGGISKISCNACHLGGPLSEHPVEWNGREVTLEVHGEYVTANGINSCRNFWCHGTRLEGVAESGPACENCHPGQAFL